MMIVLGISGGVDYPHEEVFKTKLLDAVIHDSAAALFIDGELAAAIEEERLNRIKHTGKLPVNAIKRCLNIAGIRLSDVDKIVYYCSEAEVTVEAFAYRNPQKNFPANDAKSYLADRLQTFFGEPIGREKIAFVNHHYCHAASAYFMSGFERSLIVTIDGASPEGLSGLICDAEGDGFRPLSQVTNDNSIGSFYVRVIDLLGYGPHDEYKVMGLAPYRDPSRFRRLFKKAYTLLPDGNFRFNHAWYHVLLDSATPRMKGGPFTQEHKDLAAALQEALETIVLHVLTYYREATGHTKLCMAGGVAHNCSMNGKILYAGLFDEVFVQPAAHDASNALGGALFVSRKLQPERKGDKLRDLYWGTEIPGNEDLHGILKRWERFISFRKSDQVMEEAAKIIADGSVIGWVQGRSEFGPRALGNRSILADPRPAENKSIINGMVKKREGYRPFAPSVLEEYLGEYYEVPETKAPYSFMNFVLRTKEDKRSMLGAVTHVDGTARIQTVSKETNEKYWKLIDEFRKLTGIPILLNTSFNNNVEPIVDSEEDAIASFLTTNIHYLVIGDYVIEKKRVGNVDYRHMAPKRPINAELKRSVGYTAEGEQQTVQEIRLHFGNKYRKTVSEEVFRILEQCDGEKTLDEFIRLGGYSEQTAEEITDAFIELWSLRLVIMDIHARVALHAFH